MTPAALHRIAFHGEDGVEFFHIGSRLIVAAALPLAMGIAADVLVVFYKVEQYADRCSRLSYGIHHAFRHPTRDGFSIIDIQKHGMPVLGLCNP